MITSGLLAASGLPPPLPAAISRSASSRIAAALGKRCAGSLRSAVATNPSTAGASRGLSADGAGGSSWTCLYAIEKAESPSKTS